MPDKNLFLSKLSVEPQITPLYVRLQEDKHPIFIWGSGNVASSVFHYCQKFNIEIAGCFVDTEMSGETFEGMRVQHLNDVTAQYLEFSVIIGHSHYVMGKYQLSKIKNVAAVYCITSCSYDIWDTIPICFLKEHAVILDRLYNELQDKRSRQCMITYFESRVNDRTEYIFPCAEDVVSYYLNDIFPLTDEEVLLDVGAWNGAAIWPFINAVEGKYKHIIALEPNERNFCELSENIKKRGIKKHYRKNDMCV